MRPGPNSTTFFFSPRCKALCWGLLLLLAAASCAVNPVTGKKELSLISEKEEIALGEKTDGEIRAQYGVYEDPRPVGLVASAGQVMAPLTHRPKLAYRFAVLDTPVINAFAVPGGYIYVTRGILALMNSEAELAVVLGHELGHVNARHSVRRMSKLLIIQAGLAIGGALNETLAKISGLAGVGIQILFLKYSRDDEREADALGVEYSRRAGYNPARMMDFFASLEKMGDLSGGHSLPGFLSTHPLTSERIRNVQAMILESDGRLRERPEAYLRTMENIVYGDDPRQGFVEGNVFYHPQLRFSHALPKDWKVQNTPSQVIMTSKDEKAALVLQAEKSAEDIRSFARSKAANLEGRTFIRERSAVINGLASFEQAYDLAQKDQEPLRLESTFIRKGDFVFTFSALSTAPRFQDYEKTFASVIGSFRELADRKYLDRQPRRLKLVQAPGGQTMRDIFRASGLKEEVWPQLAIMNGRELGDAPRQGTLIKIVR